MIRIAKVRLENRRESVYRAWMLNNNHIKGTLSSGLVPLMKVVAAVAYFVITYTRHDFPTVCFN